MVPVSPTHPAGSWLPFAQHPALASGSSLLLRVRLAGASLSGSATRTYHVPAGHKQGKSNQGVRGHGHFLPFQTTPTGTLSWRWRTGGPTSRPPVFRLSRRRRLHASWQRMKRLQKLALGGTRRPACRPLIAVSHPRAQPHPAMTAPCAVAVAAGPPGAAHVLRAGRCGHTRSRSSGMENQPPVICAIRVSTVSTRSVGRPQRRASRIGVPLSLRSRAYLSWCAISATPSGASAARVGRIFRENRVHDPASFRAHQGAASAEAAPLMKMRTRSPLRVRRQKPGALPVWALSSPARWFRVQQHRWLQHWRAPARAPSGRSPMQRRPRPRLLPQQWKAARCSRIPTQ